MIYIDVLMIKCKINIYVGSHGVQDVNLFKFLFFHQCKILNPAVNLVQAQFKKSNNKKKKKPNIHYSYEIKCVLVNSAH